MGNTTFSFLFPLGVRKLPRKLVYWTMEVSMSPFHPRMEQINGLSYEFSPTNIVFFLLSEHDDSSIWKLVRAWQELAYAVHVVAW